MSLILSGTDGLSDVDGSASTPAIRGTDTNTGIFFPAADTIAFTEGGVEAMRINSSGNVGISTSSPSSKLTVQGAIRHELASNTALYTTVNYDGISVKGAQDAYYLVDSGQNQTWYVGATERMRITSGGRLAVGSTTTNFPLYVKLSGDSGDWFAKLENTVGSAAYGCWINYSALSPNGAGNEFLYISDSTAQRMSVRSNGGIANYSANDVNLSDEREKTNIQLAGSYLDKICAISVKTFNYIDQNREEDDGLTLGVIAQDVQKVAPELVMESDWGTKEEPKMRLSIYQTDLQYALMKCIQEQQAMIEELKQEVAALKSTSSQ